MLPKKKIILSDLTPKPYSGPASHERSLHCFTSLKLPSVALYVVAFTFADTFDSHSLPPFVFNCLGDLAFSNTDLRPLPNRV
jgi:hypothetical protein